MDCPKLDFATKFGQKHGASSLRCLIALIDRMDNKLKIFKVSDGSSEENTEGGYVLALTSARSHCHHNYDNLTTTIVYPMIMLTPKLIVTHACTY